MLQKLRVFQSRRNWLQNGLIYRIQRPYSTMETVWSTLMPVSCFILFVTYLVYTFTDPSREDQDHTMELRDAKPHWRLSAKKYDHFYEELRFTIKSQDNQDISTLSATMYQSYAPATDHREWDCTDNLDQNPISSPFTSESTGNPGIFQSDGATLCYHDRARQFTDPKGLFICRDPATHSTTDLVLDIQSPQYKQDGFGTILEQPWDAGQSVIVTLRLWVHRSHSDEDGSKWRSIPKWQYNSFEVTNVEYVNGQFKPDGLDGGECYGVQIRMDRIVAVDTDGATAWGGVVELLALMGGAISFVVMSHTTCANLSQLVMRKCCKERWAKDQAFNDRFQKLQDAGFLKGQNSNEPEEEKANKEEVIPLDEGKVVEVQIGDVEMQ